MHPKRKKKLILTLFLLTGLSVTTGFVLWSLNTNINFFYSPSELKAEQIPVGKTFRVGGLVKKGSVKKDKDTMKVSFTVTDLANDIVVHYKGILPDLFREGQGIISLGHLEENGDFLATEVLAKHDESYMPPEVKKALEKAEKAK